MNSTDSTPPVFTVGYGKRSIDALLTLLQRWRIDFLDDVPTKPYSRFKPEFNEVPLSERLRRAGVRYVFMGDEIGGMPDDPSAYVEGKVDYKATEALPTYQAGVDRIANAFEKRLRIILMCSEGKPEMCHRSKLIGQTLAARGIPVVHLDENDEPKTQDDVLLRLTGGNGVLFEEALRFTSRGTYLPVSDEEE